MSLSNYHYDIVPIKTNDEPINVIKIIDLCNEMGGMSVTNNIEQILADICNFHELNPEDWVIIYRDSEGRWDGFDTIGYQFIPINKNSFEEAIETYYLWSKGRT
jgi:hypothetical protein